MARLVLKRSAGRAWGSRKRRRVKRNLILPQEPARGGPAKALDQIDLSAAKSSVSPEGALQTKDDLCVPVFRQIFGHGAIAT
jgi:hypothetical protein